MRKTLFYTDDTGKTIDWDAPEHQAFRIFEQDGNYGYQILYKGSEHLPSDEAIGFHTPSDAVSAAMQFVADIQAQIGRDWKNIDHKQSKREFEAWKKRNPLVLKNGLDEV